MGSALAGTAALARRGLLGLVQLDVNHWRRLAKEDNSHQDVALSLCKATDSALSSAGVGRNWQSPTLHSPICLSRSPKLPTQSCDTTINTSHRPGSSQPVFCPSYQSLSTVCILSTIFFPTFIFSNLCVCTHENIQLYLVSMCAYMYTHTSDVSKR